MLKILFYDTETTGLDPFTNGIHQLAGILIVDGHVVEEFCYDVRPFAHQPIIDKAVAVSGRTVDQVQAFPEAGSIFADLTGRLDRHVNKYDSLDKIHLAGWNNRAFDDEFLRRFFINCGSQYFGSYFWQQTIDVQVLALNALMGQRHNFKDVKLHTMASYFGVAPVGDFHNALTDARATQDIYYKLRDQDLLRKNFETLLSHLLVGEVVDIHASINTYIERVNRNYQDWWTSTIRGDIETILAMDPANGLPEILNYLGIQPGGRPLEWSGLSDAFRTYREPAGHIEAPSASELFGPYITGPENNV